jgi:LuxR family maltose regulon positive regulatory protein
MSAPIEHLLTTKLVVPTSLTRVVVRERLQQPKDKPRIVLVCAPAGYGKTTLIASWAKYSSSPIAWLSLDQSDDVPSQFLIHFIGAIQVPFAGFGTVLIEMLESTLPPPISVLMRSLVNELHALAQPLCIILDDLHAVLDPSIHEAINFLIEHQPTGVQLILASRNDPSFPLARIRAQRQLLEYRTEDLRFTLEETELFCNDVMRLGLDKSLIGKLDERAEGWVAGLQLAALSLSHHQDVSQFIECLAGDNRHITDFLIEEVLRRCSSETQQFLLKTSILKRFCAPLCDAMLEHNRSRQVLERNNMFIFGLDNKRSWYRYHQLFASLLQSRLQEAQPEQVAVLHRRASQWLSENHCFREAIDHALKSGDYDYAAELMQQHSIEIFLLGRFATALDWAQQLPVALLVNHPKLAMICAWGGLIMDNQPEVEWYVQAVRPVLMPCREQPLGSQARALFGQLALIQSCQSCLAGDLPAALVSVNEALQSLAPGRILYRGAALCLAFCHYVSRDLEQAQQLFIDYISVANAKRNLIVPMLAVFGLARCYLLQGRLLMAQQVYEHALQECISLGWQDLPICGTLHLGLGELAYLRNDLKAAEQYLSRGVDMTATGGVQYTHAWGRVMLARTRLAMGATEPVLEPLQEAGLLRYSGRFVIDIPPLSADLAHLWLSQKRMEAVTQWMEAAQLPMEPLAFERESEYVMLARYWLALKQPAKALAVLQPLLKAAQQGGRQFVIIEVLILKALALQAQDQPARALAKLQHALVLAEHVGVCRLFLDEGMALHFLLQKLAVEANSPTGSYVYRLLDQFAALRDVMSTDNEGEMLLSKKEKQIASYMIKGMTSQAIAEALFVSRSTINTHVQSIYSKLGVNKRLEAIRQLQKLGIT